MTEESPVEPAAEEPAADATAPLPPSEAESAAPPSGAESATPAPGAEAAAPSPGVEAPQPPTAWGPPSGVGGSYREQLTMPPYYAGPPAPFAPRPPREPWINPRRRTAVLVTGVVAALALLFVGAIVGHAVDRHHVTRFDPVGDRGVIGKNLPPGGPDHRGPRGTQAPDNGRPGPRLNRPPATVTVTVTPVPTAASTG